MRAFSDWCGIAMKVRSEPSQDIPSVVSQRDVSRHVRKPPKTLAVLAKVLGHAKSLISGAGEVWAKNDRLWTPQACPSQPTGEFARREDYPL